MNPLEWVELDRDNLKGASVAQLVEQLSPHLQRRQAVSIHLKGKYLLFALEIMLKRNSTELHSIYLPCDIVLLVNSSLILLH